LQVSTNEDALRTQLYRQKAQRKVARREARHLPLSVFLRQLGLRVEIRSPISGAELARVAQLTTRTNQMNATLQRFGSEAELRTWLSAGRAAAGGAVLSTSAWGVTIAHPACPITQTNVVADTSEDADANDSADVNDDADANDSADAEPSVSADRWVLAAWCSDRFGVYGLVGCALCRLLLPSSGAFPTECAGGSSLVVLDAFNMSCRVLHRGVEIALLKHAARDSASRGALLLALPLIPTTGERKGNQLMQRFVTRLRTWLDQRRPHSANAPVSAPKSSPRAPIIAPEAPITARFVRVFVGSRATPATALLLRVSELEALDVSAWLDAVQDAEDDEAEADHQRPSEGPTEGPSERPSEMQPEGAAGSARSASRTDEVVEMAVAAAEGVGGADVSDVASVVASVVALPASATAAAVPTAPAPTAPAPAPTAAAPDRPRCWDALLEHASQMRAGIIQEVVAAASRL
jgi:hypothetical protein